MTWTFGYHSWRHFFFAYKTCEKLCYGSPEDCPQGYECVYTDHGPRPDSYCRRRPSWPWEQPQPDGGSPALPGP